MNRHLALVFVLVSSAFVFTDADAVEVLTAEELASHCVAFPDDADSVDGEYCVRYIQGFIDGAIATDVRVMLNMEAEREEKDSFTERAIRTRMIDRNMQMRASGYAEFCRGDPEPLAAVVGKVVADLTERMKSMDSAGSARDAVYESLRRNYPCKAS